jgi:DNA-binding HxlR family transcriptional regulator
MIEQTLDELQADHLIEKNRMGQYSLTELGEKFARVKHLM